jgi:glycosyltransferase involved in cell wall biosynthesis
VRLAYLTDRLSLRGGADQHLLQVVAAMAEAGVEITVGCGRAEPSVSLPAGVRGARIRGLASPIASAARLAGLDELLRQHDVVHLQNVMNPVVLERAVATGHAAVTVQDHRFFCPGPGRTLPDGTRCTEPMSEHACARCLPDAAYRSRLLELTAARRDAIRGAAVVVLSSYMADELKAAGINHVEVIPPWVRIGGPRRHPGHGLLLGGRLVEHKAVDEAWQAWRRSGTDQPLRIAGAGPLEGSLEGTRHLGWLGPERLAQALRESRALLFPSRWQEPFGILGLEALAQGVPVIVTARGGAPDWSAHGCLRITPCASPLGAKADPARDREHRVAAMAEAISQLASDPRLALELGEAGRQSAAEQFARARIEPRLHELYRRLA